MNADELYMQRCLQLAEEGMGNVAPNPMVGAVLVYRERIIGEGYHRQYGGPHAEVNCIDNVPERYMHLISESTLYVSLEPCSHFGKTPPCADLIISNKIPKVVIACRDSFEEVNGSGIKKLQASGIEVITGVLEKEALWLNRRFFSFHQHNRPYIILKWAQSADMKIAGEHFTPIKISNEITNRLVHKWRGEEAAIMVGTKTAVVDDPLLTTRLWTGNNPLRIVADRNLQLPASLNLLNQQHPTIILNGLKQQQDGNNLFYKYDEAAGIPVAAIKALHEKNIISVLIEGGARLLQSFIDIGLWDEARIITGTSVMIKNGIAAPVLKDECIINKTIIRSDRISWYRRNES